MNFYPIDIKSADWKRLDCFADRTVFQTRVWLQFVAESQNAVLGQHGHGVLRLGDELQPLARLEDGAVGETVEAFPVGGFDVDGIEVHSFSDFIVNGKSSAGTVLAPSRETRQAASLREISRKLSPANSFIGSDAFWTPCLIQMDEVNHDLFGSKIFGDLISARRLVAKNHYLGAAQYTLQVGRKHGSNVRDDFFDVLAIGTGEAAEGNVFVPNFDVQTLAHETLDQLHLRALAQIVGSGFEA